MFEWSDTILRSNFPTSSKLYPVCTAVQTGYNFDDVGKLLLNIVSDHSNMLGSGAMVSNSLTHNFLKYGHAVSELKDNLYEIQINQKKNSLSLSCTITCLLYTSPSPRDFG